MIKYKIGRGFLKKTIFLCSQFYNRFADCIEKDTIYLYRDQFQHLESRTQ